MKIPGLKPLWLLIKDSAIAWDDDNIASQGAALAYFTVFSLSPLLTLVIVFSSIGLGQQAANGHLVSQIRGLLGNDGAQFIQTLISNAYNSHSSVLAAIVSVGMLLVGASAVFIQLRDSLNTIWRLQSKPTGTVNAFVRARIWSFAMTFGIGFLLLISLVLSAVLAAMSEYISNSFTILAGLVSLLDFLMSFAGITVMFALIFKFVPAATLTWKDTWVGAAATSLLFSLGKLVIGLYLGNGAIGSTFGAASSLIIIMLWTYYSSQIFLLGAEFTRLYAKRFGSDILPDTSALRVIRPKVEIAPKQPKKIKQAPPPAAVTAR
jgi:membrane protein